VWFWALNHAVIEGNIYKEALETDIKMGVIDKTLEFLPKPVSRQIYAILVKMFFLVNFRRLKRFYSQFISPGDLVFDVGANVGNITSVFLKLGARVVSVDPRPSCVRKLKSRFGRNSQVTVVAEGVSDRAGKLDFHVCEKRSGISTFSDRWTKGRFSNQEWGKKISVNVTTLDLLIKKYRAPRFCKIDVEGFELKVLKGLKEKIRFISFEFDRAEFEDARNCVNQLSSSFNVRFNYSLFNRFELESGDWLSADDVMAQLTRIKGSELYGDIYARIE